MLLQFGYSQYESKVYETLVTQGEAMDASGIVKLSGVPKAKVYEVLDRLVDKGVVMDTISGKKRTYASLPLEAVIDKLTREFEEDIRQLREASVSKSAANGQVWSLKSYSSIQAFCRQMIQEARESVLVSMWSEEFAAFTELLNRKEQEGVRVEALVTGDDPPGAALSKLYVLKPSAGHDKLERFMLLVTDTRQLLFAGVENGSWQAIETQGQPFVKVFAEFFYHDMALTAFSRKYPEEMLQDEELQSLLLRLRY
ncbi:TrmB family transcriptional regulator [Paenibacillus sp. F411]|uniref:Sugar-specific transcriptional regulator TrmB n=1 Tax=Paenibacillus algicola TaxID=2565926 RepID=A0A4P8XPG6_9BACL|nr:MULTISPECIES: helix-turn-helix domain-containing protein [Paenibacillus]MBO2944633.1 TrmB family transcriptional regulator [Paenibacillus sp. F411]QCT04732.1 Sugar-specific transcriptional regulator TrmB [Paenibacillus algicola]